MSILEPEPRSASRHDVVALASGLLVFVASFLPWYGVSLKGPAETGVTGTFNAWHGLAGIGLILLLFSLVVAAGEPYFSEDGSSRVLAGVAAALACVGALFVVIRSFSLPSLDVPGASVGLRWGGWILIVLVIVQAGLSVMRVLSADDRNQAASSAA